jgi:hypothetical protein
MRTKIRQLPSQMNPAAAAPNSFDEQQMIANIAHDCPSCAANNHANFMNAQKFNAPNTQLNAEALQAALQAHSIASEEQQQASVSLKRKGAAVKVREGIFGDFKGIEAKGFEVCSAGIRRLDKKIEVEIFFEFK